MFKQFYSSLINAIQIIKRKDLLKHFRIALFIFPKAFAK